MRIQVFFYCLFYCLFLCVKLTIVYFIGTIRGREMEFEEEEIQLSIILQDVINNRTSEEWQEIFRQSIEEDSAIIAEVMDENDRLHNQNKALAVVVGGLALCIIGLIAKRMHENKAEPSRKRKF